MVRSLVLVSTAVVLAVAAGCASRTAPVARTVEESSIPPNALTDEWRTRAERTDYAETGRYNEVVAFCQRLARHPYAEYGVLGVSGEGRDIPVLLLSRDCALPQRPATSDRPLVLLQNCIHPGECAGKDASLELARDILITGAHAELLAAVDLLIIPMFNVDGHERFGPYCRINQNGPREMGWRATATNLNLNRDYTKADAVEMQHWLRTWTGRPPDLFFDNHTTDGSDHQYDLLYTAAVGPGIAPPVSDWLEDELLPKLLPRIAADGHKVLEYSFPRDRSDLSQGIDVAVGFSPRYSTGYGAIYNRPTFLLEAHALKPYRRRVRTTYDFMLHVLEVLNAEPARLRTAVRAAEAECVRRRGAGPDGRIALTRASTDDYELITYQGVAARMLPSEIAGGEVVEYSGQPVTVETRLYNRARVEKSVVPPAAYLVPPQWSEVIGRLELHGVEFYRLRQTVRLNVEAYRFENVTFPSRPFEGRFQPRYETIATREMRDFPAGTVVVPMGQPRATLAAHLLEPEAPDSLVAWGFFNAIFEQKEYAESYVMEPLAREMLAADAALREEFEQKLRTDEGFAKSPGARLDFFYCRSPYRDVALNAYPVGRLLDEAVLARLAGGE